MNKDFKYKNTIGIESTFPKDMPKGFVASRSFHIAPDRGMSIMWFETQQDLDINFNGMVGSSAVSYKKMYSKVANQLLQGKEVTIEYSKIDLDGKELSNTASPDLIKPNSVYEKLQEISGEIQVLSAKLDGKDIV